MRHHRVLLSSGYLNLSSLSRNFVVPVSLFDILGKKAAIYLLKEHLKRCVKFVGPIPVGNILSGQIAVTDTYLHLISSKRLRRTIIILHSQRLSRYRMRNPSSDEAQLGQSAKDDSI